MKKKTIAIAAALAAVAAAGLCLASQLFSSGTYYYTQVDNSKIEQVHSSGGVIDLTGGLGYSYTLTAYKENGAAEEVSFGMSRQLREGAFLRLKAVPVRGVVDWAEVQYDELPPAVQRYYAPPEAGPSLPAE
ncbi:MAG: YxeA family protein [Oscillospiraceae bacterium]|nr:YxeA family protein [Oscillospiraceae bacterium]MCI8761520.1 YxeA family protein [Oscillospiraceae bacterium]MCI8807707.1 YxeA family protein [Oscillospiraceae bacterium]MCI9308429.1 YxeA family protein [Oscillospiraceae bacterium]MCI9548890.1 YxeA family protein [Oscillospiraceae bacterium]